VAACVDEETAPLEHELVVGADQIHEHERRVVAACMARHQLGAKRLLPT
jgi:hypothetical protein